MSAKEPGKRKLCEKCGKELKPVVCAECGGDGTRGILSWKRTCQSCGGTGLVLRCPDAFKPSHLPTRIIPSTPRQFNLRQTLQARKCPSCGGQMQTVTCPACSGQGRKMSTRPGEWTQQDLRKNPFLPWTKATPSPMTIYTDCERCHGTGRITFCPNCNRPTKLFR